MPSFEIVCLANSTKHGGRCVAGLRMDGGGWIRPVSARPDGALLPAHYMLDDGSVPRLLDVIEVPVSKKVPLVNQPENWEISGAKWRLIRRSPPGLSKVLDSAILTGKEIFGDVQHHISLETITAKGVPGSLALVRPEQLSFSLDQFEGKTKVRALFSLDGEPYNLPVTDPGLADSVKKTGVDPVDPSLLWAKNSKMILTISLAEVFQGKCYKLVAAAFPRPA